tara:strand:- start:106 stop:309 length:204 start_codon:yes stop_codon:yes gene_type:complete
MDLHTIIKDWSIVKSTDTNEKLCWCLENCESKFYNRSGTWYFKNSRDATLFGLKYGSDHNEEAGINI